MNRRVLIAFALLAVAGGARIVLQLAAMPPYAGLDEIYHVARVRFVVNEDRNPTDVEPSVAAYLHRSLSVEEGVVPDYVNASPRWREMVRAGYRLPSDEPVPEDGRTTYLTPNYEAQQASLYYTIAAVIMDWFGGETRLGELRLLRWFSALLAFCTVLLTGFIGYRIASIRGIAVAAIVLLLPTWHTLMIRASNDALAVATVTGAVALSLFGTRRLIPLEALLWAGALATKLLTWPLLVVLPVIWWRRNIARSRMIIIGLACMIAIVATGLELRSRTGVPVGLGAFDAPQTTRTEPQPVLPIEYDEMLKVTVSSAIWMSGQHNNALTTEGMALYVLPPLFLVGLLLFLAPPPPKDRRWALACLAAIGSFALAQAFHASAHIRNAQLAGETIPAAGKEGWYWFVLVPLILGLVAAPLFARLRGFLLVIVILWLFGWDLTITEGALFRDYAGLSGPETPGALFRWGPAPFIRYDAGEKLAGLAVGPFTSAILGLRITTFAAIVALLTVASLQPRREGEAPAEPRPAL